MGYANYIKELGRGAQGSRSLSRHEAEQLYGAILDGGVPDLELGALIIALRMKGESLEEMQGFFAAAEGRMHALTSLTGRPRPVVLASYNGSRKAANLTPLLALLLQRFGVPVLIHGLIEGFGRVTSAHVFRELGIMPSVSLSQAQQGIAASQAVFVPLSVLSPGLANQLALRSRLGLRNCAHSLVKVLDPFKGDGMVVAAATHPPYLDLMQELLIGAGRRGLVLRGTEGEPFANPTRRPRISYVHDGGAEVLFEAEHESIKSLPHLPDEADARTTAQWIRRVLDDHLPLPLPMAHQLACCLYASGAAGDFNQAKAIVAVDGGVLAAIAG
jgi:anthranilate phosphoribosyltransferase